MKLVWRITLLLPLVAMQFPAGTALAQAYPSKPVRIVVPFPPGGNADTLARLVGAKLTEALHQPVLVENRPGAGGQIALDAVARAAPDGHTILINTNGHAILPALYRKLPFDAVKDFAPVTQLSSTTLVMLASPKTPVNSVQELIALAKAKPRSLNYGSTGVGVVLHLTMELLKLSAGVDIVAVQYKGDLQISNAMMSGEIDVAVVPLPSSLQFVRAGRLRALGMTGARRSAALPEVPTIAESGFPGFETSSWQGFFVPAKTPREVIDQIQQQTAKALHLPDVRTRMEAFGNEVVGSTPDEFDATFKADLAKFSRIVRDARIPVQD